MYSTVLYSEHATHTHRPGIPSGGARGRHMYVCVDENNMPPPPPTNSAGTLGVITT
jgi:hypothetical protein